MKTKVLLFLLVSLILTSGCATISTTEPLTGERNASPQNIKLALVPWAKSYDEEFKAKGGGNETATDRVKNIALRMNSFSKVDIASLEKKEFKKSDEDLLRELVKKDFEALQQKKSKGPLSLNEDYITFAKEKGYDLVLYGRVLSTKQDKKINAWIVLKIIFFGGLIGNFIPENTYEYEIEMEMAAYDIKKEKTIWQRNEKTTASKAYKFVGMRASSAIIEEQELRNQLFLTAFNNAVVVSLADLKEKMGR
jgi:hypothetical protein